MMKFTLNKKAMEFYNNTMQAKAYAMGCKYTPQSKEVLEDMFNDMLEEKLSKRPLKVNPRGYAKIYIGDLKITIDVTRNEIRWLDVYYEGNENFGFAI